MTQEDPSRAFNITTCAMLAVFSLCFLGMAGYEWSLEDEVYGPVLGKELPLVLSVITGGMAWYCRP